MKTLYHLSLEEEIVAELNSADAGPDPGPRIRRETVLAMVARSAQLSLPFHELLNEAGLLSASAFEMEYFGYAEIRRAGSLHLGWGQIADTPRNVDPVPVECPDDARESGFAYALACRHPVVVFNAALEDRFHDARMVDYRIRTGMICPIVFRDEPYGAVGIFSSQARAMNRQDVMFLQSVALLLGPTRAHQNAERAMAEQSRFLSTAMDSLDALVVLASEDGTISRVNRACAEAVGCAADELCGRKLSAVLARAPEDRSLETAVTGVRDAGELLRCEATLVNRQGETRRISWKFTRLPSRAADAALLGTGVDITEQQRDFSKLEHLASTTAAPAAGSATEGSPPAADAPRDLAGDKEADQAHSTDAAADRRSQNRRPFGCIQSIAPCISGKLPERGQFRAVRCYDISSRGFSFLLASEPHFDELVAAFGPSQSRLFLRSRVVHSTRFRHEGRNVVLVGCEYLGRVRLPWIEQCLDSRAATSN